MCAVNTDIAGSSNECYNYQHRGNYNIRESCHSSERCMVTVA